MIPPPIDFDKWYAENPHLLAPPVKNFCLYQSDDYVVMAVGGPNERNDFHLNETEEWFYQKKGDMLLRIVEDDAFRDIPIKQGCMFMLPSNTPHNPIRFENTVGFVVERRRPEGSQDSLRWYCTNASAHPNPTLIRQVSFHCTDLQTQLPVYIKEWMSNESLRKCSECGQVAEAK